MHRIDPRITRTIAELERLCTRLGMISAAQAIIGAEVDITRLLENLDSILPLSNARYREKESVEREEALAECMEEEAVTKKDIEAARLLLTRLIFHKEDVASDRPARTDKLGSTASDGESE